MLAKIWNNHLMGILFLLIVPYTLLGQKKNGFVNDLVLEGKLHYGGLQPHHESMRYLINYNAYGTELSLSTYSYGRHKWESMYRYPRFGVSYMGLDLGNKELLGYAHSFFGFLDVPIYTGEKGFSFRYEIDFGFGYLTKVFDVEDNPLNMAIGSHINMMVGIDFNLKYNFNGRNAVKAGLDLTHFSNGKIKTPNLGYNLFTFNLGYLYTLKEKKYEPIKYVADSATRKSYFDFTLNAGYKTDDMVSGNHYIISTFVGDYWYAFSPMYLTGAGFDFFYDPSLIYVNELKTRTEANSLDAFQFGLHGSLSSRYNRLHVLFQVGAYLHTNYVPKSIIYSRFGFRYFLSEKIYFNFTLKAHKAIADYIEWGVGVRL